MPRHAIFIFVLFNFFAMIFYPGGTLNDPNTTGYTFTENFFSDLGNSIAIQDRKTLYHLFYLILAYHYVD